jgi:hypothetical protein
MLGGSVGGATQYLAGQIDDIVLTAGVASTKTITPYYVAFPSTSGNCGILARSTVPGTTIRDTYGCAGNSCTVHPAGEFAAVGSAYPVDSTIVAPNQTGGATNYIPFAFNGSAPTGTHGFLELAYALDDVGVGRFVFARVPIYVGSASGWNRVISTAGTIVGSRLVLSHPFLNGNPSAVLFVSHVYNPRAGFGGTKWDHPLSVEYHTGRSRWTIKNADNAAMKPGLGFNFRIDPSARKVCVPPGGTGSEFSPGLVVDDYNANSNPFASLGVTPISGPPRPVAVKYDAPYWSIVYADGSPLTGGTCFNVKVIAFSQYIDNPAQLDLSGKSNTTIDIGVGEDLGGTNHTIAGTRILPFNWAGRDATLPMIFTSNLTPIGWPPPAAPDTKNSALRFTPPCLAPVRCTWPDRKWALQHEDGSPVPDNLRVNVWARPEPLQSVLPVPPLPLAPPRP